MLQKALLVCCSWETAAVLISCGCPSPIELGELTGQQLFRLCIVDKHLVSDGELTRHQRVRQDAAGSDFTALKTSMIFTVRGNTPSIKKLTSFSALPP